MNQDGFDARFDWGSAGVARLAPHVDPRLLFGGQKVDVEGLIFSERVKAGLGCIKPRF